ncbi:MAG: O-antigen ligase family protein [Caldilineaceae bacterium]|nr:O-antigen ligase family protein [Caldilineaceae bacterium]
MEHSALTALARGRFTQLAGAALLALLLGAGWLVMFRAMEPPLRPLPAAQHLEELTGGAVASMDSPLFNYTAGWRVSPAGADPPEPAAPFAEPAGVVEFAYTGRDLALQIAPGDYWAYLYITVDGLPANQLPAIAGNVDSQGHLAGYKTLLEPERVPAPGATTVRWLPVHQADHGVHQVRVEVWRAWNQTPLRAVGVNLQSAAPPPRWPGLLLILIGFGLLAAALWQIQTLWRPRLLAWRQLLAAISAPVFDAASPGWAWILTGTGLCSVVAAVVLEQWLLCVAGVGLLLLAGTSRPALWLAALLGGLPFAYGVKLPLLPGRVVDLVDLGALAALVVVGGHLLINSKAPTEADRGGRLHVPLAFLATLSGWALISAVESRYPGLALREWRTVFLNSLLFGIALAMTLRWSPQQEADRRLLVAAWLAGAAAMAGAGLLGYVMGGQLITNAEGVWRVQGFYGSPNNLALYLDRTLAVTLALALFQRPLRAQLVWMALALIQLLALLLTFSKGSILLALPAIFVTLLAGGLWLLRRQGRSTRHLWWLVILALVGALVLAPFIGTERLQRAVSLTEGTGFLRLQLWRSAWQMAKDHSLLGVGPDNFLYYYRSDYMLPAAWQEPNLNHPHNLFLDWWTRLGIPGLLLGLGWLAAGATGIVRALQRGARPALALGILAAAVGGLVHGLIDVSYALPDLMLVWVLLFGIEDT